MAINYTNLFADLGKYVLGIEGIETMMTDAIADRDAIVTQLNSTGVEDLIGPVNDFYAGFIAQLESSTEQLRDLMGARITERETVVEELSELTSSDVDSVILALTANMIANSQDVKNSTVTLGSITKSTTNTNTGDLILTQKIPGNSEMGQGYKENRHMVGVTSQMSLDDAVKVICDNDSQSGTTEGAESFLITGIQPQRS